MTPEAEGSPHDKRREMVVKDNIFRGKLKHGNPSGDFSNAPRCGAKNRRGTPCQCPAMRNGRCRLHGGLSTGARTPEGIERIRQAVRKHGRYSEDEKALRWIKREEYRRMARYYGPALAALYTYGDGASLAQYLLGGSGRVRILERWRKPRSGER